MSFVRKRRPKRPMACPQAEPGFSSRRETHMDLRLNSKTALVTGGSEGIGKGIALALAKEGVDVAICARRKEPLEQTAAEISKATGRKIVATATGAARKEAAGETGRRDQQGDRPQDRRDRGRPAQGRRRQGLHRAGPQGAR